MATCWAVQTIGLEVEASTAPERDGLTPLHLNGRDYRLLRLHGSRIVDPGDPSGGKFRPVTILYGAPTGPLWHGIEQAMTFYIVGSLVLLAVSEPTYRMDAASWTDAAAPAWPRSRVKFLRMHGSLIPQRVRAAHRNLHR